MNGKNEIERVARLIFDSHRAWLKRKRMPYKEPWEVAPKQYQEALLWVARAVIADREKPSPPPVAAASEER
jgi:hypothetical protein